MRYPFNVYQTIVENHSFWVAECPALKGCVAQGDTAEEALAELETNENEWLETAKKYGIAIPEVPIEKISPYSGKFTVRVAPYVHQEAAENAYKQGISLNQYVNDAIVAQNNRFNAVNYISTELKMTVEAFKDMVFNSSISESGANITRIELVDPFSNSNRILQAFAPYQI